MRSWFKRPPVRTLGRYRYVRLRWRILFACIDALGWAIVKLLRAPHSWHHAPHDESPHAEREVNYVLLVQLDHLGDAILSLGLLRGLRAAYPKARIDVLASSSNVELFAACPEVGRVLISPVNRFARGRRFSWIFATLHWGWRLRRQGYDLAIDPRGDFPAAVILWLSGARIRLGWDCGGGGFLLTHRAEFIADRHEVLSRQALLNRLGIAPPAGETAWHPRFVVSPEARESCEAITASRSPLIVLHPGAGTQAKHWPSGNWRELLGRLILEHELQVVFVGSADERPLVDAILQGLAWPAVRNFCGELSIKQLAALLERADLVIGSDSGPAHLAAAVGTPVVAVFSGTNREVQWRPWGENVKTVRHESPCSPCHRQRCPLLDHPCMAGVHPFSVLAAAHELLCSSRNPTTKGRWPTMERTPS